MAQGDILLQTRVNPEEGRPKLDLEHGVVLLGSCFAEHMGNKLEYYGFRSVLNPFGIIFNPVSLRIVLQRVAAQRPFTRNDIFQAREGWHCFETHSALSCPDADLMVEGLNKAVRNLREGVEQASHIVLTLGTSWVYRHIKSNEVVANCHKVPQHNFSKELLSISQIEEELALIGEALNKIHPGVKVVATVSPVRHIKDGIVQNQRGKAHLISALHSFLQTQGSWSYFPSYEILIDELRDYRFYAEDLIHPSAVAVDIVWDRFCKCWVDPAAEPLMNRVAKVRRGVLHRPFNPDAEAHKKFRESLRVEARALLEEIPHLQFPGLD